jgi:hypothetical protein
MIAAPVLFIASDSIWPVTSTEASDILSDATGATGRVYGATLLALVGFVLLTGAVIGLAHLLHERRPGLALVGGALGLIGIVGNAAAFGTFGMLLAEAPGRDAGMMTALPDDLMARAAPAFIVGLLLSAGVIVLAVGLQKARVVAPWAAYGLGIAALAIGVASPLALKPVVLAADVLLFASLASIGWQVLSETDEEWAHTPEFHGYRTPVTA